MSFNQKQPAPAPTLPDRGNDYPIHEDDEEEDLERDVSHVGSLPDSLPVHGQSHIKNSPSIDTMKILAEADSTYNMNEQENHYTSNAKRNEIALPSEPIPQEIVLDADYLGQFKEQKEFNMYRVTQDFHPMEERHLEAQTGDIVSGMQDINGWILGFTDDKPDTFGFIPDNYL
jgi:hypothetical protein